MLTLAKIAVKRFTVAEICSFQILAYVKTHKPATVLELLCAEAEHLNDKIGTSDVKK